MAVTPLVIRRLIARSELPEIWPKADFIPSRHGAEEVHAAPWYDGNPVRKQFDAELVIWLNATS